MKSSTSSALACSAILLLALPARADVTPPETQPCVGKQAGDACTLGAAGTCQYQTCIKLDYANWDRDASMSPPSTTYVCLQCITSNATNTTTNTATSSPTTTNTTTTTITSTDTQTSQDDGFCSIGKTSAARRIAPWLMAGAFSLLFLFGWRRRKP